MEVPPTSGMPWLQPRRVMWRRPGWIGIEAWKGGGFRYDQKPVIQTKRMWPCCLGWIYVFGVYIYMIAGSLNHQHHKTWNSHVVFAEQWLHGTQIGYCFMFSPKELLKVLSAFIQRFSGRRLPSPGIIGNPPFVGRLGDWTESTGIICWLLGIVVEKHLETTWNNLQWFGQKRYVKWEVRSKSENSFKQLPTTNDVMLCYPSSISEPKWNPPKITGKVLVPTELYVRRPTTLYSQEVPNKHFLVRAKDCLKTIFFFRCELI